MFLFSEGEIDEATPALKPSEPETSEENNTIDISQCIESGIEMTTGSDLEQFTPSSAMNEKLKKLSMCGSEDHQESIYKALENSYFDDSQQVIAIVYNKEAMPDRNPVLKKQRAVKRVSSLG